MIALQEFKVFVDELKELGSTTHKKNVLKKYKDNENIAFMLRYIFNPYVVNGISEKKLAKKFDDLPDVNLSSIEVLEAVAELRTGSDDAIKLVKGFAKKLKGSEKSLFYQIVKKNLPLGIGVLSINKVMPGLIPTFDIMLAEKYENHIDYVLGQEFTLTRKIDGGRIIMLKQGGEVHFYTRAGQIYEGLIELELEASKLPDDIMLDGEITLLNAEGLDNKEQYKRTMMITRRDGMKTGIKMLVFDYMPIDCFCANNWNAPYEYRRKRMLSIVKPDEFKFFEVLPSLYCGSDINMINVILEQQIARGEEGIMLNINSAPYAFSRTKDLLKVKKMKDVDLTVVDLVNGVNSNENRLGAFVVEYKGNQVRVGSGIDLETRERVWANKEDYIGSVIKVQYFEETTNQKGGISLRFPVFLGFRDDKVGDY